MRRLAELEPRVAARIVALESGGLAAEELRERLGELGFLPGERVLVLARAAFGGPLAVRVGSGTFALRVAEAHGVLVEVGEVLEIAEVVEVVEVVATSA